MLNLRALEHLRLVAEGGSFAAAARTLGVSQPAVAQRARDGHFGVHVLPDERPHAAAVAAAENSMEETTTMAMTGLRM